MAITAQQVVERIQKNLGGAWNAQTVDMFHSGQPDSAVNGVVTTYAPTFEVMRRAVAAKHNMIVCRESPYWTRGVPPGSTRANNARAAMEALAKSPTYRAKREFIEKNGLIIYRLTSNWDARKQDQQVIGLAKALGWEKYYKPSGGEPWAKGNGYFAIPPATLRETAQAVKKTLKMKSIRIVGKLDTRVSKAAVSTGMYTVAQLERHLAEPGVDLVVIGEPVEWGSKPLYGRYRGVGAEEGDDRARPASLRRARLRGDGDLAEGVCRRSPGRVDPRGRACMDAVLTRRRHMETAMNSTNLSRRQFCPAHRNRSARRPHAGACTIRADHRRGDREPHQEEPGNPLERLYLPGHV